MKKNLLLIGIPLFFSSCAINSGLTSNLNNNTTEVVLAKKNFKVVESVMGESKATYILGFGGLSKKGMIAEAKTNMLSKANILGSSRAIINQNVEVKSSLFPFVRTYKVIVSGHIIEFTD